MTNLHEDFLQGPILLESPTPSKTAGEKVTNEDLQATMMAILKTVERSSQNVEKDSWETKEKISRLFSITGDLQRRLDMEYSSLEKKQAKVIIGEASPTKELVTPTFPVLSEKRDKGKNKEESESAQPVLEEISRTEMPDSLLSLNIKGQIGQERTKYGMPEWIGESSGKKESTKMDKPLPYRPPLLTNKGGERKWRKPEPNKEVNSGNNHSPRWEPRPRSPPSNGANQQIRDELADLRRMVVRNAQP
ncbi:hypothetical protein EV2_028993 [Malus domestica]